MHPFLRELTDKLAPTVSKIVDHSYLRHLQEGSLSIQELRRFAVEYHAYSLCVPNLIAAVASNVPDDATRLPLVRNLWDEHGEGALDRSHRTLYSRFASALGLTGKDLALADVSRSTRYYVDQLDTMCRNGHFLEGLGVIGPGMEGFTSTEYTCILRGLRSSSAGLAESDLEFWSVHVEVDDDHYLELVNAMEPWLDDRECQHLIASGAQRAVDLELTFWDGLYSSS